jgi:hypothetical protein
VDEWAGTFDGEKRQKLQIAIDPVLTRLGELLSQAQEGTDSLRAPAASAEGLDAGHAAPLAAASGHLTEAQRVIADLRSRTEGTPYAFVGLQLQNIRSADIDPAHARLGEVAIDPGVALNNSERIEKASFHIQSARDRLAALTRTYESVKRDQQVADAMQRLSRMYQVFLEDTQALLGGAQPPINSYQRKIAEVDDAYVEKLKELLEEKKKIMAELARLLSKDPRLLRRYLASLELQGTSYRDQMTLLAERQKELQTQLARWNATSEDGRSALGGEFRETYQLRQGRVIEDAVKLRDNLETWLPLDADPETEKVKAVFTRAERIAQFAADTARPDGIQAGEQALEELRALREALPPLGTLSTTNSSRMTAYVANRVAEIDDLITAQSGHLKIMESLGAGDFAKVAEIVEHRIAQESTTLGEKLEATEEQVASMSDEIAKKAALLNQILRDDILQPQGVSLEQFAHREMAPAQQTLDALVSSFARAEDVFDELMAMIIAKLDEAPPPDAPGGNQDLESLLAMLEDEMKAAEGLGIPCRPVNVSIMRDWMRPGAQQGQGMSQAQLQAQAAQAQAMEGKAHIERLEREARASADKALAEAREQGEAADTAAAGAIQRGEAWNKLASRLGRDLLQGRDNTPPEQYRAAIENYFRNLANQSSAEKK